VKGKWGGGRTPFTHVMPMNKGIETFGERMEAEK
jgi:hypothetical protein